MRLALDRRGWPTAWLLSLSVHGLALVLLGLAFRMPTPRGIPVSLAAAFSLAQDGRDRFDDEGTLQDSAVMPDGSKPATAVDPAAALQQLLGGLAPADPTSALPALASAEPAAGGAQAVDRGPGAGRGGFVAGRARTSIFGVPGEGTKFVYVFDRSGSTGGPRNTLGAAKAELVSSLEALGPTHQFQIIFYNERPSVFNAIGRGRLVFATEQNKELARRFIGSITPDGGTRHEEALALALKMQPEQLESIHRMGGGVQINAIEFGTGQPSKEENFMVRLAQQSGGRYGYVDVTRLARVTGP